MNYKIMISVLLAAIMGGCAGSRVLRSDELPVMGDSPLMHTTYRGSDDKFHHFIVQHGKSYTTVRVRQDEAEIQPKPYPLGSGSAFVRSAEVGVIRLVTIPTDPQ